MIDLSFHGIGDQGVAHLAEALQYNPRVRELRLDSNRVQKQGATALAQLLPLVPVLEELHLRDNLLGAEGMTALAKVLATHIHLRVLDVSGNAIGPQGGLAIANALGSPLCGVQKLNLDLNEIGTQAGFALAAAVQNNEELLQLNVGRNGLGDAVAQALLGAVQGSRLEHLNLQSNNIGPSGASAIALMLPSLSLRGLSLRGNAIGDEGLHSLSEAITQNQHFTSLELDSCDYEPSTQSSGSYLRNLTQAKNVLLSSSRCTNIQSILNRNIQSCTDGGAAPHRCGSFVLPQGSSN